MEAYSQEIIKDSAFYVAYTKARSWISTFLGIILTVLGILVVFIVSSLEGTKEVVASNTLSGTLLNVWREQNQGENYPEPMVDIVRYEGRDYYFVVVFDDVETEMIEQWHFAYDAGIDYVFTDYKFYVLTSITSLVSIYVAHINYTTTTRSVMGTELFVKTLRHYQEKKNKVEKYTQFIPDFCSYKNKQAFESVKRNLIEQAGINYELYIKNEKDEAFLSKIEPWQKKILEKTKKIKVGKIYSHDLLQEHGSVGVDLSINLLPIGQKEHQRKFFVGGVIQRVLTSALSGLTIAFGIVLGNWVLGLTYGISVFISFVSSVVIASDYVSTTLRNRFLAKADLLNEFDNIKEQFFVDNKDKKIV
jgi:hypothetical protein